MMFRTIAAGIATSAALLGATAPALEAGETGETVKIFYQAFNENRPELLDAVLAPDWEDTPLSPGQQPGRDGFKPMIGGFNEMISGLKITNDDIIEAGDKVVVRSTVSGTQAGPFAGFASKGRPFSIMAIDIHEFADGKIVRSWHIEDWLSGLFQMGAFEPAQ